MKKCKAWTYRIFRNTQRHLSLGLSCLCISLTNFEIWAEMQSRENRFIIVSFPPLQKLLQAAWQHHWRHERNRKRFISGLINRCEHTSTQTKPRVQSREEDKPENTESERNISRLDFTPQWDKRKQDTVIAAPWGSLRPLALCLQRFERLWKVKESLSNV